MSTVTYVTPKQMESRTGMPNALGYATRSGNILIRKGLDRKTERKVRKHEAEHVARGEEGPFLGSIVGAIGGSLVSGLLGDRSSRRAANAQTGANNAAIAEDRRQFDTILELTEPGRNAGNHALTLLQQILTPGGDVNVEDLISRMPGHSGIVDDTMRSIRQSGAAGGSTGGNVLAALGDRIGNLTSDRLFGSLFGLAGLGQPGTNIAANAAGNSALNVGNLLQSSGVANASGIMGAGNSQNAALQNIMQMITLQGLMGGGGSPAGRNFAMPGSGLTGFDTNAIRGLRI